MDANEAIARIIAAESSTYTWGDFGFEVSAILAAYRLNTPGCRCGNAGCQES